MDSGGRGMNPVAMTIINPRKKYWPSRGSNQQPPVLKPCTLPTELRGVAESMESDEREMRPVAINIVNDRKKYWPCRGSNQRPPVLKPCTLPTDLRDVA